jgi:hypothetical protein
MNNTIVPNSWKDNGISCPVIHPSITSSGETKNAMCLKRIGKKRIKNCF